MDEWKILEEETSDGRNILEEGASEEWKILEEDISDGRNILEEETSEG